MTIVHYIYMFVFLLILISIIPPKYVWIGFLISDINKNAHISKLYVKSLIAPENDKCQPLS